MEPFHPIIFKRNERYRPANDQPPAWWPRGDAESEWRIPAWWQPQGPALAAQWQEGDGRWVGLFVSYDPESEWFHYWEWMRHGVRVPEPVVRGSALDLAVQLITRDMVQEQVPPDSEGWLHMPATPVPIELQMPELKQMSLMVRPDLARPGLIVAVQGVSLPWPMICW